MKIARDKSSEWEVFHADCIEHMKTMGEGSVDLVFGSPPYEDRRTYSMGFKLVGQGWVDWMVEVVKASLRVSRGLVGFVVEGKTEDFRWSATPALLMADLHREGIHLRKPPAFHRVGICGSGGPDWVRNDWEFIICATNGGKLPWSDNTACGAPPKYGPGGEMAHRMTDGQRVNKTSTSGYKNGDAISKRKRYDPPDLANPGNVLTFSVGGSKMGHRLSHENEAPFPLGLPEFFIKSFCPPGGIVFDPFMGSGTTLHAAIINGRRSVGCDTRESQVTLTKRRLNKIPRRFTY